MEGCLSKKELLSHPEKETFIERAKKAVLLEMDAENKRLFRTLTKEQQEDFIIDLAYEDQVIEFKRNPDKAQ